MPRARNAVLIALIALGAAGCNNGNSNGNGPSSPNPPPTAQNPCASVSLLSERAPADAAAHAAAKRRAPDVEDPYGYLDAIWRHRSRIDAGRASLTAPQPAQDIGDIAVLQDRGDLVLPQHLFDLRSIGVRFSPNGSGGYSVSTTSAEFRAPLGNRLTLSDDDSAMAGIPFGFTLYGRAETEAFINSDGNVTFGEADKASSARNVSRLLTGPPRVAPFLSDLDPSAGGGVFLNATSGGFTVTWCNVRAFDSQRTTTFQTTLLPDGAVELKFGPTITVSTGVAGISPGRTGDFASVDLSAGAGSGGAGQAIGERFSNQIELDTVAVARRFYEDHPDLYDQLVIWTDTILTIEAFAYENTVANEVRGLGRDLYDLSREFGSGARLRSLVVMDWLGKYPSDPFQKFLGENDTLSILGQEAGHRWLAFLEFRDHRGRRSDALLGRDLAHWSFFFDSDASVMEGNDIEDLGGGSFRTVDAVRRYSLLDRYAMGLIPESAVSPFFYVESPTNISTTIRGAAGAPQIGVTFNGTRRDVLIQDVVAVMGPRLPTASESPKVLRQAFLYVVGQGRSAEVDHVAKLERIRQEWESFFSRATDAAGRVETRLRPPS